MTPVHECFEKRAKFIGVHRTKTLKLKCQKMLHEATSSISVCTFIFYIQSMNEIEGIINIKVPYQLQLFSFVMQKQ